MVLCCRHWIISSVLLSLAIPALAFEYDEDVVRPHEPAMANIVDPQTLNDIRDIMIKESIQKHGFCACPYSTDALGGQCGTLSAYFLPWNKILCYRRDISNDEVYFYRLDKATNAYQAQLDAEEAQRIAEEEANNPDNQEQNQAKKRKELTADYFRNSAKPLPNTITLPSNISLNPQARSAEEDLTGNYFKNVVPVTPASSMTNLIAPPVPATPTYQQQ